MINDLNAGEHSFLLPETTDEQEDLPKQTADVLQNFVAQGKRCGFKTTLVAGYLIHKDKALATWAEETGHRNKDDLAFCLVAYVIARKPEAVIKHRLGEKATATWLARPRVQALLAEIVAGKEAIATYERELTEKIAEVLGFPGVEPESPNVREWLAGGHTDYSLLTTQEERLEAATWF